MFTLKHWSFPSNNNGALSGINDSGIETFNGTKYSDFPVKPIYIESIRRIDK